MSSKVCFEKKKKKQYNAYYNKEQNAKEHFIRNALRTKGFVLCFFWNFVVKPPIIKMFIST